METPWSASECDRHEHIDRHLGIRDCDIVTGMHAGDVHVIERLFLVYFPILVRFARASIRSEDVAEEVVADLFCWLWEHRDVWRPKGTVESYLFAATWNRVQNVMRGERRAATWLNRFLRDDQIPGLGSIRAEHDTEHDTEQGADRIADILALFERFSERNRLILTLRWQHGLKFDEIAAVVGISSDAVKKAHRRSLDALRRMLPRDLS